MSFQKFISRSGKIAIVYWMLNTWDGCGIPGMDVVYLGWLIDLVALMLRRLSREFPYKGMITKGWFCLHFNHKTKFIDPGKTVVTQCWQKNKNQYTIGKIHQSVKQLCKQMGHNLDPEYIPRIILENSQKPQSKILFSIQKKTYGKPVSCFLGTFTFTGVSIVELCQ